MWGIFVCFRLEVEVSLNHLGRGCDMWIAMSSNVSWMRSNPCLRVSLNYICLHTYNRTPAQQLGSIAQW